MSMSEANKPGQDVPEEERVVLCGANSYDEKYYLNPRFSNLPKQIQDELKVMCVLYTNDVGGILLLEFDKDGYLHFRTEATENDTTYDEIGAVLKIKELQRSEEELLRSLEMYYRVLLANGLG